MFCLFQLLYYPCIQFDMKNLDINKHNKQLQKIKYLDHKLIDKIAEIKTINFPLLNIDIENIILLLNVYQIQVLNINFYETKLSMVTPCYCEILDSMTLFDFNINVLYNSIVNICYSIQLTNYKRFILIAYHNRILNFIKSCIVFVINNEQDKIKKYKEELIRIYDVVLEILRSENTNMDLKHIKAFLIVNNTIDLHNFIMLMLYGLNKNNHNALIFINHLATQFNKIDFIENNDIFEKIRQIDDEYEKNQTPFSIYLDIPISNQKNNINNILFKKVSSFDGPDDIRME